VSETDTKQALAEAKRQSHHISELLSDGSTALKELADTHRQLHAEIDRKQGEIDKAKGTHRDALKHVVEILRKDAHRLSDGIKHRRELQAKRRALLKRLADKIRRLRKRLHHHGGDADFRTGFYHFARPDLNSAEEEADHFVAAVKAAGGKLVGLDAWEAGHGDLGALDFEHTPYSHDWVARWVDRYKQLTGCHPVIYGGGYSLSPLGSDFGSPLWLAAYASDPGPYIPSAWRDTGWNWWQYTSSGSVPGVSGGCDVSKYRDGGTGPDVSVYQGDVNWGAVASASLFGWCKATEGRTYTDPSFSKARVQAMHAAR
jgi:GH25 family lysozyme M1 (1,4-beta-N-acetylmuramidase)